MGINSVGNGGNIMLNLLNALNQNMNPDMNNNFPSQNGNGTNNQPNVQFSFGGGMGPFGVMGGMGPFGPTGGPGGVQFFGGNLGGDGGGGIQLGDYVLGDINSVISQIMQTERQNVDGGARPATDNLLKKLKKVKVTKEMIDSVKK